MNKNKLLAVLTLFLLTGCNTARYKVETNHFGEQNLEQNEETAEKAKKAPWEKKYPVKIYTGKLPEGLELDHNNNLVVKKEFESRYKVIGSVTSKQDELNRITLGDLWWYNDAHEKHGAFLDVYCKVQTPLRMLTLGLWFLVPFNYPCMYAPITNKTENYKLHSQEIKRAANAMGANVVIINSETNKTHTSLTGHFGKGGYIMSSSYEIEAASITGFAVYDNTLKK